jgi:hypothetical protein
LNANIRIILINGKELASYIFDYKLGMQTENVIEIKRWIAISGIASRMIRLENNSNRERDSFSPQKGMCLCKGQ